MSPERRASRTTNTTTFFFRERQGLDFVAEHALVPRSARGASTAIWSAGCGTGEEVYSLAMMAREIRAEAQIVGTDVNDEALDKARFGRYPERRLRHVSLARRDRWFTIHDQYYRVRKVLRDSVQLLTADLAHDPSPRLSVGFGFHVVICRNVFMYLHTNQIPVALASMLGALEPGGLVILGAAEGAIPRVHQFLAETSGIEILSLRGATVAKKREAGEARRAPASNVGRPRESQTRQTSSSPRAASTPRPAVPPSPAPPDTVDQLQVAGDEHLDQGRTDKAVALYRRALALDDLRPELYFRLGFACMSLGSLPEAEESLRRCLFLEPKFWPAALLLADLSGAEHPADARRYLKQARDVLRSPASSDLHLGKIESFAIGRPAALAAIERRLRRL